VKFFKYLKLCREKAKLTQEELVHELYSFDINSFKGLNTSTLSKWERDITQPKVAKQVSIIRYFQKHTGVSLPHWDNCTVEDAEERICQAGVENIIGKSKKYILDFPSKNMHSKDIHICLLKDSSKMNTLLELNMVIHEEFNLDYAQISLEQFKSWAIHPSNLFLTCEYKDTFMGLLFTIRLKPEVFEKIISFKMKKSDITENDFVSLEEEGCDYILSVFALNHKSSHLLFVRYYAYLIANQKYIKEVGTIKSEKDAKNILEKMNFKSVYTKQCINSIDIVSYKEALSNVLVCENAIKIILTNGNGYKS